MKDKSSEEKAKEPLNISDLRRAVLEWLKKTNAGKKKNEKIEKEPSAKPLVKPVKLPAVKTSKAANPRKAKVSRLILFLALAGIFILLSLSFCLYYFKWQNGVSAYLTEVIPYPVAFVNNHPLYYHDWQKGVKDLSRYYKKIKDNNPAAPVPTLKETEENVLERMIERELLEEAARQYNFAVSDEEVEKQTQDLIKQFRDEDAFTEQLKNLYNWTLSDFQKEILRPLLMKNKLSLALLDDKINQAPKLMAENVLKQVNNPTADFAALAKRYSYDISARDGGDIGYVGRGQLFPELDQAVFALKPGEVSGIIKTPLGFHIVKVEKQLTDEKGATDKVQVRIILIRGVDAAAYLKDLQAKSKIWRLVNVG